MVQQKKSNLFSQAAFTYIHGMFLIYAVKYNGITKKKQPVFTGCFYIHTWNVFDLSCQDQLDNFTY